VTRSVQKATNASYIIRKNERRYRALMRKKILNPDRIRRIEGGFSFIPHRFLTDGFLAVLDQREILLYFFLVLVSDRYGLSFYSYDAICSFLQITIDQYIVARDGLMEKDLIAFDGSIFQVLDLPKKPIPSSNLKKDPAAIAQLIGKSLKENEHDP